MSRKPEQVIGLVQQSIFGFGSVKASGTYILGTE
jgi:hypothetical protein